MGSYQVIWLGVPAGKEDARSRVAGYLSGSFSDARPCCAVLGEAIVDANVLIVDDSPVMVNTLNTILSSQGCRVETCSDGEAGWRHLMARVSGKGPMPDVLLLDLNMPGLDGLTLLDRIRNEDQLARLPIIIITADSDLQTRMKALGAGADDYLAKPVELSDLLKRVELLSAR